MELLLVRHGIAESQDASKWPDDRGRPLTAEGAERFRRAARGLGVLVPTVDALFTSELTRAAQTAVILRDELGWPDPEPRVELEPSASAADAVRVLSPVAGSDAVALVGHEPNLSELASYLLTGRDDDAGFDLKKGGVISLGIDGLPEPGTAILYWAIPPRALRGMSS